MTRVVLAISAAVCALSIHAEANATIVSISFDEKPARDFIPLTDAYAAQGVTFLGTNAGLWTGLAGGDPGSWGLTGTDGDQFLGFNGPYGETMTFATAVTMVGLDFARASGSTNNSIDMRAFDGASLVAKVSVDLGSPNIWEHLSVSGAHITSVTFAANGSRFHPFGADGLVFRTAAVAAVPEPATWALLVLGFGSLGATLRRRRSLAAA